MQGQTMHRHAPDSSGPLRHCRQRGFTLVELVIVVFMVGVLATLAGPLFRDFIIQQSIRNAAFELMSDLTFARSEAVKRNVSVTMSKIGSGAWTGGWKIAAGTTTLRQHPAVSPSITITMDDASFDFLLNGRASGLAKFTIDDAGGKTNIIARCVSVDPGGRPQSVEGAC
jgi:type IV fimbrial biogenesis protein FimT